MGRILGIILIIGGLIVGAIIAFLMIIYNREGSLTTGAATLGFVLGIIALVLPQLGFGTFLLWQGIQEETKIAQAQQQRQILDIVRSHGQITISDLVIEMQSSQDKVKEMIHQLVGMGLFSGYINWDEGILHARQAKDLHQLGRCEHCAGELQLAGKGVIQCPYCGTEYFL